MKKRNRLRWTQRRCFMALLTALFSLTAVLFLTGCGGDAAVEEKGQPDMKEPVQKSQLMMSRQFDTTNLDPVLMINNEDIWTINLMIEGLVRAADDGTGIEPWLAESWEVSSDLLTYTFHLKEGVKFSDGAAVTGEDWIFSILRARDTKESYWKSGAQAIKEVMSPDDRTLVITLNYTSASFLSDMAMFNVGVQKKAYYDQVGEEGYTAGCITTGPYRLKEWVKGEYFLLEANPYYHVEGLPKTKEIKILAVADDETRLLQLQAGEVDVVTQVPNSRLAAMDAAEGIKGTAFSSTQICYFIMNNTKEPFQDVRVRQAIRYAMDQEQIVKLVLYGNGEAATSFMPKNGLYWNQQLPQPERDVEKAKALLADAGYPEGISFDILIRSGNAEMENIAIILKEQLAEAGMKVTVTSLETQSAKDLYYNMKHDVIINYWTDDVCDPMGITGYWMDYDGAKCYYTGWYKEEAQELVDTAAREMDTQRRGQLYNRLQEIFYEEVPAIPIYYGTYPVALRDKVEGFWQTPLGHYRLAETIVYE